MANTSVMIVGVGGQGTLLASRILGNVAIDQGCDVKVSEVHGMAQRGGSVVTYVKYGDKVYSPVISEGEADIILAFEKLEAYRWLPYLKKEGKLIINTQKIDPMPVIVGNAKYPEQIIEKINRLGVNVIPADALKLALKAGNVKAVNVVLLGLLAKYTDISKESWIKAIKGTVPGKFLDINMAAFDLGYNLEE
ncbi:MAG: indolepyruvate ferredoxin oxidoreductase, beta subunit [Petroclostridium sp.]|uniref:indolepyruvate oxidoreductase subunit beta n=1 Tax=Petroclostridium xylanilyticum TaxID=1792311 RepID=UPI000B9807CF|nr:indolepyruvate oxidoreductase subunit beta [Petroclostridium xylanilyticum]MBZ4645762.1 indolepyruvate ferredoxin oxidoreductase, beta subunit [Clostridia bacterium]MDK2810916.1 indolepyruvate ferredoxin oxidoreductase, beta subunit [Petroclostridium sp.]